MADLRSNPLAGKRIVITRALAESEALARELAARGAIPVVFPLVSFSQPEDFSALDKAIDEIAHFDWIILTSVRAVRALSDRASELGRSVVPGLRAACVGPVTAEAARDRKFSVEYVATIHSGVALADELGSRLNGVKVLLPRSDRANPDLPAALKQRGAVVTEVIAYRTLRTAEANRSSLEELGRDGPDALLFFSPSAVRFSPVLFGFQGVGMSKNAITVVAVGQVTAKALREAEFRRVVVAADTTAASVIETLEKHFEAEAKAAPAGAKSR